jgi:hypothetical protein
MVLHADFLARLQRHDDQLAAAGGVKHFAEVVSGKRAFLDIDAVARHVSSMDKDDDGSAAAVLG